MPLARLDGRWMGTFRRLAGSVRRGLGRVIEIEGGLMLALSVRHDLSVRGVTLVEGFTEINAITDDGPLCAPMVAGRRRQGHVLYGIEEHGRLRAHGWVSGPGLEVGVVHAMMFTVPPRCIYIWDCETLPGERNRGRFQALLRGMLGTVPNAGTAYVAVDFGNTASRTALDKVGFRPLFRFYGLKLLGHPVLELAHYGWRFVRGPRAFDRLGSQVSGPGGGHGEG